jgi:eukaryotic-like serine/threonine-protein kinase
MTSRNERWSTLKNLFAEIVELPLSERLTAVEIACHDDFEMRRELESLLLSDDCATGLTGQPVVAMDWPVPITIGAYRVVREIGSGGMGTVYLAERQDESQKPVAIKVIRAGFAADHVLRRFILERQILARLDHPNIARFLDGGTTAEGLPYFVMEYVDGLPIDVYCTQHNLSVEERLSLLMPICAAVQFAHQSLIIHRDIKPANILITADGSPRLLDFGIAKILDAGDSSSTVTGMGPLTPDYASPEHILGQPLTTASDVYSLGVVLFELLTEQLPYCKTGRSAVMRSNASIESEPPRPSRVAFGGASQNRRLRGDIDNIVMMALRNDPARRYGSAANFAEDIRRHLEGLPVTARPATLRYRAEKFVRRNRAGVIAVVTIVAALVGGMIATARQTRVAERAKQQAESRSADVRKLSTELLFGLHDALETLPGSIAARQMLVARALEYLDRLSVEGSEDGVLKMELATAYERVGSLSFDMKKALSGYENALVLGREVLLSNPDDTAHALAVLSILSNTADLLKMMGQTSKALRFTQEALAISERLVRLSPGDARFWSQLDLAQSRFGFVLQDAGEHAEALRHYRAALFAADRAARLMPSNVYYRRRTAVEQTYIGINLAALGEYAQAIASFNQAGATISPLAVSDPVNAMYQRDLWNLYLHRGTARFAAGEVADAFGDLGRALAIKEFLSSADPGDTGHQRGLAVTHLAFGQACAGTMARQEEAMEHYQMALRLSESLTSADLLNFESRMDVARIERSIGARLVSANRASEARVHFQRSKAAFEKCKAMSRGNHEPSRQLRILEATLANSASP